MWGNRNEIKMEATSTCSVNVDAGTGTSLYSKEKRGTIQLTRAHEEAIRFGLECISMTGISLKECQLKAIQAALNGNHTFISLPTGFGKSIVYQVVVLQLYSLAYQYELLC